MELHTDSCSLKLSVCIRFPIGGRNHQQFSHLSEKQHDLTVVVSCVVDLNQRYLCMYVCICMYVYVCIYIYIYTTTTTTTNHTLISILARERCLRQPRLQSGELRLEPERPCAHVICVYIYIYIYMLHTHIHTHTHTHMCIYIYV